MGGTGWSAGEYELGVKGDHPWPPSDPLSLWMCHVAGEYELGVKEDLVGARHHEPPEPQPRKPSNVERRPLQPQNTREYVQQAMDKAFR